MKNKKKIVISKETLMKLTDEFNVSKETIWNACRFKTNNYSAAVMRKRAMELGGIEVVN